MDLGVLREVLRGICIFVSEHAFALKNLLTLLGSKEPRQVTSNFWEAQKLNIHIPQKRKPEEYGEHPLYKLAGEKKKAQTGNETRTSIV